jgi:hypothetical protein
VIHFEHPEGTGRENSIGTKTIMEDKKENTVTVPMKLCCNSKIQFAHVTSAFFAVTCIDCIENFKALKPELFAVPAEVPPTT